MLVSVQSAVVTVRHVRIVLTLALCCKLAGLVTACWLDSPRVFNQSCEVQVNKLSLTCCGHIQLASVQMVSIIAGGHDEKAC